MASIREDVLPEEVGISSTERRPAGEPPLPGSVPVTEHGTVVGSLDAGHLLAALRRVMFDAQHSPVTSPTTAVGTLPG